MMTMRMIMIMMTVVVVATINLKCRTASGLKHSSIDILYTGIGSNGEVIVRS